MKNFLLALFLISTFDIYSHEFNPAHLVIEQSNKSEYLYEATWMYPFKNIGKRAEVIFPNNC